MSWEETSAVSEHPATSWWLGLERGREGQRWVDAETAGMQAAASALQALLLRACRRTENENLNQERFYSPPTLLWLKGAHFAAGGVGGARGGVSRGGPP